MKESWRDIPGYDGKYQVDMNGNVRRICGSGKARTMKPYPKKMSGSPRLVVKLTKDGKAKEVILLQIMARTFLGVPRRIMCHITEMGVSQITTYRILRISAKKSLENVLEKIQGGSR